MNQYILLDSITDGMQYGNLNRWGGWKFKCEEIYIAGRDGNLNPGAGPGDAINYHPAQDSALKFRPVQGMVTRNRNFDSFS